MIEEAPKPKPAASPDELASILDQLGQYSPQDSEEIKKPQQPPKPQLIEDQPSSQLIEDAPSPSEDEPIQNFSSRQPSLQQPSHYQLPPDQMQELIEAAIEERFQKMLEKFGDLGMWKERTSRDMISIKQELIRTQDRFHQLQKAVLGKVAEYNDNISSVNSEMKALEKVFEKIIEPLTNNIKELQRITERLKK